MQEPELEDIKIDDTDQNVVKSEPGAPSNEVGVPAEPAVPAEPVKPVKSSKRTITLLILLVLATVLAVMIWFWGDEVVNYFAPKNNDSSNQAIVKKPTNSDLTADPELAHFIKPTTGETWLSTPKNIASQGWLKLEDISKYQDQGVGTSYYQSAKDQMVQVAPTYKEVGSRQGNTIVLVSSPNYGIGGLNILLEKRADGSVVAIVNPQESAGNKAERLSEIKELVSDKVTILDESTHYDSLNIPSKIAIGNDEFVQRPDYLMIVDMFASPSDDTAKTLVMELGGSKLYKTEKKYTDTGLTNIGYFIETPLKTNIGVRYEPNKVSLEGYSFTNGADLQFKDYEGKTVFDSLVGIARGCGGNISSVTRSDTLKDVDLVQVGKTDTGRSVYEPKDKNSVLYQKAYDEYKSGRGSPVAKDEFVRLHALVIIKNAKSELLVYTRSQYAPSMGCAKPVVYLYPTATTMVNVKVGADVTVSDPLYPVGGWNNVLAQPDGRLTYQNKPYDSLFWEGQGFGDYPGITSGTVVKRAEAVSTIRRQLTQQGMNNKEIADFMAFWESKIPNKPYIRLTWLNTAQMNRLAPLNITPRPDTVIRVFLDMDGFDRPLSLPTQKLTKVERRGFTVVEWGGLTGQIRH